MQNDSNPDSCYTLIKHFSAKRLKLEKLSQNERLARHVSTIRESQAEEIKLLKTALIQMKINVGILTDEMEGAFQKHNEDIVAVFDEIDCLGQLIRAVGDSGESTNVDHSRRLDAVARESYSQITKLTETVSQLKKVLIESEKTKLAEDIEQAQETMEKIERAEAEKARLAGQLGQIKGDTRKRNDKRRNLRDRIAHLRQSVTVPKL